MSHLSTTNLHNVAGISIQQGWFSDFVLTAFTFTTESGDTFTFSASSKEPLSLPVMTKHFAGSAPAPVDTAEVVLS
ncbi:MAG: hypothetical protein H0W48_00230 [Methylibium sp.]|nr:hypothetical protein [Methylibium sp.]